MIWEIKTTKVFDRHMGSLTDRFNITKHEALEIIDEIGVAAGLLRENGTLPSEYNFQLHELTVAPWTGFMEFHVADDILVVYAEVSKKRVIRLTGIYNHQMLSNGRLD